jgi:radical SAM protein with 4Fe4S-binding SPASM domain
MVMRLLSEVSEAGIRQVGFSGGEPLLRDDLAALIDHGRSAGLEHFGLVTNGYLVNRARARALVDAGLNAVQVSVDGVDAADHTAARGCGPQDFYRALRAVRIFLDLGITVDIATILSPTNLRRAPEMAMFCEALGVRGLRYCTFIPRGRGAASEVKANYALDPNQVDRFLALMRHLNRQPDARLQLFIDHGIGPWLESGTFRCVAGRKVAYISAEGDLYPCPALIFPPFKIGNVFETPVRELLEAPGMAVTRSFPRTEIEGPCSSCANPRCSGGCRGAAFARSNDLRATVSYCAFERRLSSTSSNDSNRPY